MAIFENLSAREQRTPLWLRSFIIMCVGLSASQGQTSIVLSLEKTTYLIDESIWFEAEEKNTTDEVVFSSILRPAARSYCKVILKDSKAREWPYRGGIDYIPYQPHWKGHEMQPGQTRYLVKDLLGIFGESDETTSPFVFRLPPGHYSLQVLLHTNYHWIKGFGELFREYGPEAHNIADKRTVYSNIVEFDVVEPTGIEREVREKLIEAYRLEWQIKQGSTVQREIFPILKSILDDHPESVYTIAAYWAMRGGIASHVGYRMDPAEYLVKFSDHIVSGEFAGSWRKEIILENAAELKRKYPDSRLVKYIDHEFQYGRLKEYK